MSKAKLKKLLKEMPKDEVINLVMELYDAKKEAKEYLEYYLEPDECAMLESYRRIIKEEFYPTKTLWEPKTRFSVCRKAISDFSKLKPAPENMAELMVSYMEYATQFTFDYGDMWEQYYDAVERNFERTLKFVTVHALLPAFRLRLHQCVLWSKHCGWGFEDAMTDLYDEYCAK
ncbi:MAG: hypothetical protein HUK02_07340 [Bacteroidaceae bacterium]|nr:hypothetical protein [Bacteroidaceae bacterium]